MKRRDWLRDSPVWSRALLPVGVTVAVTMILLSGLDAIKTARRLPPQVGFIPVDAHTVAVTSSLEGLWRNVGQHAARLSNPAPDSYWAEVNSSLSKLSAHCLGFESVDDLSAAGLDPNGGLSVALMGLPPDLLATVPVRDPGIALQTISALTLPTIPVHLNGPTHDTEVAAFVVEPSLIENAVLCLVPQGAPFRGSPQALEGETRIDVAPLAGLSSDVRLSLAPIGGGPARLILSCHAILRDGSGERPCHCEIDHQAGCDALYEFDPGLPSIVPWSPGPERRTDGEGIWTVQDSHLFIGFSDKRMIVASRPELVQGATARRNERATRFVGDNGLLGLVDQFHADASVGDATILGLLQNVEEPVAGNVPFALTAGPDRIRLRAALPLDTFRLEFLVDLVADSASPPPSLTDGAPLGALVNDPAVGSYFTLADSLYGKWARRWGESDSSSWEASTAYEDPMIDEFEDEPLVVSENFEDPSVGDMTEEPIIPPPIVLEEPEVTPPGCGFRENVASASLYGKLGNFAPVVRGLAALERVGPLDGYLLDVRDGVPEMALVQRGVSPMRMERLIDDTRTRMKKDRDIKILCRARAAYWDDHGGEAYPVDRDGVLSYLGNEGHDLLSRYSLQEEYIVSTDDREAFDFDTAAYRHRMGRFDIGFIPPPITDLDLRYRFDAEGWSDLDTQALRDDAFRLAYARLADDAVAFGTDARTLDRFLGIQNAPPDTGSRHPEEKLLAFGNPEHLVTLGMLYPDDSIRTLFSTGGFEVLDQYRSLRLSVRPSDLFEGLSLEAELSHD